MDESWGLKSILDASDDVALFVVCERDEKILYCNHLVTIKTGIHAGSSFKNVWNEYTKLVDSHNESRISRYHFDETPFGPDKNVTVTKIVWEGGLLAYAFIVAPHTKSSDDRDREAILNALGKSFLNVRVIDAEDENSVHTVFLHDKQSMWLYKPMSIEEWRASLLENYVYIDDVEKVSECLDYNNIIKGVNEDDDGITLQYRRKCNDEYRWTEMHIAYLSSDDNKKRIVCTEKDIHGDLAVNRENLDNDLIMKSLANIYRSVYLLDLENGEYTTVKPDKLLFGIPGEGVFEELIQIVCELIPDATQKKDLNEYFSLEALRNAFKSDVENIGREYNSCLSEGVNWMNISVFKPPYKKGMENKCVVTFMDITEHKRVEAERNENSIAIDVLSSRYVAVIFVKESDYSYNVIRIPQRYKYIEKQFDNIHDAANHYISAYVLENYKKLLRINVDLDTHVGEGEEEDNINQEFVFKNVEDNWIRLTISRVAGGGNGDAEFIMAFEDYNDIMDQYSSSSLYSKMILADYELMYEYDPQKDIFYILVYDGTRLVRQLPENNQDHSLRPRVEYYIHPDDKDYFMIACNLYNVSECLKDGKTVSHLYLRRRDEAGGYHAYMYGFHYFEEFENKTVLILARDADKELV